MKDNITVLFQLLPKGTYANKGYVVSLSNQFLRFDIKLDRDTCINNETMLEESMDIVSITGGNNRNHSGDQGIEDLVTRYGSRVQAKDKQKFMHLVDIWRKYHLNSFTPGTKKQEEAIAIWKETNKYNFDAASKHLESLGLNPDRGYKYGSNWLCRSIPNSDIAFLRSLSQVNKIVF